MFRCRRWAFSDCWRGRWGAGPSCPRAARASGKCLWEGKIIFDPYSSAEPPSELIVFVFYSPYILRLDTVCAGELSLQLPQAAIYSRNTLINPLYFNCPVPDSRQPRWQERQINPAKHPAEKRLILTQVSAKSEIWHRGNEIKISPKGAGGFEISNINLCSLRHLFCLYLCCIIL